MASTEVRSPWEEPLIVPGGKSAWQDLVDVQGLIRHKVGFSLEREDRFPLLLSIKAAFPDWKVTVFSIALCNGSRRIGSADVVDHARAMKEMRSVIVIAPRTAIVCILFLFFLKNIFYY